MGLSLPRPSLTWLEARPVAIRKGSTTWGWQVMAGDMNAAHLGLLLDADNFTNVY